MAEDLKRNGASAISLKQSSDDRKLSLTASASKKVIIKSADMKDDMQKEAIDIAIAVVSLSLSQFLCLRFLFFWKMELIYPFFSMFAFCDSSIWV